MYVYVYVCVHVCVSVCENLMIYKEHKIWRIFLDLSKFHYLGISWSVMYLIESNKNWLIELIDFTWPDFTFHLVKGGVTEFPTHTF